MNESLINSDYMNCIVCFELLDEESEQKIWTCEECKIQIHQQCINRWKLKKEKFRCPHCNKKYKNTSYTKRKIYKTNDCEEKIKYIAVSFIIFVILIILFFIYFLSNHFKLEFSLY